MASIKNESSSVPSRGDWTNARLAAGACLILTDSDKSGGFSMAPGKTAQYFRTCKKRRIFRISYNRMPCEEAGAGRGVRCTLYNPEFQKKSLSCVQRESPRIKLEAYIFHGTWRCRRHGHAERVMPCAEREPLVHTIFLVVRRVGADLGQTTCCKWLPRSTPLDKHIRIKLLRRTRTPTSTGCLEWSITDQQPGSNAGV